MYDLIIRDKKENIPVVSPRLVIDITIKRLANSFGFKKESITKGLIVDLYA